MVWVDLPEDRFAGSEHLYVVPLDEVRQMYKEMYDEETGTAELVRLDVGVYQTHPNFDHEIKHLIVTDHPFEWWWDHYPYRKVPGYEDLSANVKKGLEEQFTRERMKGLREHDFNGPAEHGVCDTPEQIKERWPQLETDPRRFVVSVTPMYKANQPTSGGWRWHKWGTYIGTKNPQHEYLADEGPEFEVVYVFEIHQVKEY